MNGLKKSLAGEDTGKGTIGSNMEPFAKHKGVVAALDRVNVDTDQIIPKQFLKRIERTGFGQFLFFDWRFLADESLNPCLLYTSPSPRD